MKHAMPVIHNERFSTTLQSREKLESLKDIPVRGLEFSSRCRDRKVEKECVG